jgi:hypothetical protein
VISAGFDTIGKTACNLVTSYKGGVIDPDRSVFIEQAFLSREIEYIIRTNNGTVEGNEDAKYNQYRVVLS